MVDSVLESICMKLNASIVNERSAGNNLFIDISGENRNSYLTVQYVDGRIYNVYFKGAQYFDLPDNALYEIIQSILSGSYRIVVKGIIRKRDVPVINIDGQDFYPGMFDKELR